MTFDVPENLYYLESHEWIDPDTVRVGISDFAQDELGDIVFVELPDEGDHLDADETFGVVESIKAVSDIYAPVSGDVTAVNDALGDQPELVNDDPFGEGWLLELDVEQDDLDELLTAEGYEDQIA
jgi:glycine cleavage system H protein